MSTPNVKLTENQNVLTVNSPYNADFVADARKLGGKWSGGAWQFDVRNRAAVEKLCREVYGTAGEAVETCSVRVTCVTDWTEAAAPLVLFGRTLARGFGRDSGAKPGDGVAILEGRVKTGGSMKNWRVTAEPGTVFLLHDVPVSLVQEAQALHKPEIMLIEREGEPVAEVAPVAEQPALDDSAPALSAAEESVLADILNDVPLPVAEVGSGPYLTSVHLYDGPLQRRYESISAALDYLSECGAMILSEDREAAPAFLATGYPVAYTVRGGLRATLQMVPVAPAAPVAAAPAAAEHDLTSLATASLSAGLAGWQRSALIDMADTPGTPADVLVRLMQCTDEQLVLAAGFAPMLPALLQSELPAGHQALRAEPAPARVVLNSITTRAVGDIQSFAGTLLIGEALQNMERPGHALSLTPEVSEAYKLLLPGLNLAWCASRAGLFRGYPAADLGGIDWQAVFAAGQTYRTQLLAELAR